MLKVGVEVVLILLSCLMSWTAMHVNHRQLNEPIARYRVVSIIVPVGTLTDKLHEFSKEPATVVE